MHLSGILLTSAWVNFEMNMQKMFWPLAFTLIIKIMFMDLSLKRVSLTSDSTLFYKEIDWITDF